MESSEQWVQNYFGEQGFHVEKIPESKDESPDFLVITQSDTRLLIELKQKFNSESFEDRKNEALDNGEIFESFDVLSRTSLFSKVIRKAAKQLAAQKEKYNAKYCLAFLEATGPDSSGKVTKFKVNLYGSKTILTTGNKVLDVPIDCYFYSHSDFFNNKDILDGAFVVGNSTLTLCVNPLSLNYPEFINSDFVTKFRPGVLDPLEQENLGKAFVIMGSIDRNDTSKLNSHLAQKYQIDANIIPVDWPEITVCTRVDLS